MKDRACGYVTLLIERHGRARYDCSGTEYYRIAQIECNSQSSVSFEAPSLLTRIHLSQIYLQFITNEWNMLIRTVARAVVRKILSPI